jgi:hypothetical protein
MLFKVASKAACRQAGLYPGSLNYKTGSAFPKGMDAKPK